MSGDHAYARTRLDALRQLRREGYAVVNREALALLIARYENGDTTRDEESDLALGDLRSSAGNGSHAEGVQP